MTRRRREGDSESGSKHAVFMRMKLVSSSLHVSSSTPLSLEGRGIVLNLSHYTADTGGEGITFCPGLL